MLDRTFHRISIRCSTGKLQAEARALSTSPTYLREVNMAMDMEDLRSAMGKVQAGTPKGAASSVSPTGRAKRGVRWSPLPDGVEFTHSAAEYDRTSWEEKW